MVVEDRSISTIIAEKIRDIIDIKFISLKKDTLEAVVDVEENIKNLEKQFLTFKNLIEESKNLTLTELSGISDSIKTHITEFKKSIEEQFNSTSKSLKDSMQENSNKIQKNGILEGFNKLVDNIDNRFNEIQENITTLNKGFENIPKNFTEISQKHQQNIENLINNKIEEFLKINKNLETSLNDKLNQINHLLNDQKENNNKLAENHEMFSQKLDDILSKFKRIKSIDVFPKESALPKTEKKSQSIEIYSSPALEFSPIFKSEANKSAILNSLSELEKLAKKDKIKGEELEKYTKDVRDVVFENLVQRGAIMELLKEGIQNFKRNPGVIDSEYMQEFSARLSAFRKVCDNGPIGK